MLQVKYLLTLIFILTSAMAQAKVFRIKAGNHYASGVHGGLFVSTSQSFQAKFDQTAEYYLGNSNQYDINKLYGFSDCSSSHHRNSARFGWVWNDRSLALEIHAYVYAGGARSSKFITQVNLNQTYDYRIQVGKYQYEFTVNGQKVTLPRGCKSSKAWGYKLYPYFGGDEVAPHDIYIDIK